MLRIKTSILIQMETFERFLYSSNVPLNIAWRDLLDRESLKRFIAAMVAYRVRRPKTHGTFAGIFPVLLVLS